MFMFVDFQASKEAKFESQRRAVILSCPFDQYRSKSGSGLRRQAPIPVPIPKVPKAIKYENSPEPKESSLDNFVEDPIYNVTGRMSDFILLNLFAIFIF